MQRKTARDFAPEVLQLFDEYVHGLRSRRGFLEGAARYTTGVVTAEVLLEQLSPNFALAQKVPEHDARIRTSRMDFESPQGYGKGRAYVAEPAQAAGKLPAVLVVHENRGLNPHIEDIARRLALEGFLAFAPDALYPEGGYPGDEDMARAVFVQLDQNKTRADFLAAAALLRTMPAGNGKVGVIGFCYGGGVANFVATRVPALNAAVSFYGPQPPHDAAVQIKSPMMLHYAGEDQRITAGWPAYEAALKEAGVRYEAFVYPGVQHGFNNDTTPRYDEAAATLAWSRSIAFLRSELQA